ncbi:hypothetical protein AXF42_Ash018528 [Apostasia shenzhenica]|uniref:Uncharacterized protein n=1 Tax=Apostasia shenzhenica TaxID=1088818 RepID=A0A2H9ZZI4_9ASPA|nr:hypothetical protein AXF42_Ash018528 [Apostasia shenzhenica]
MRAKTLWGNWEQGNCDGGGRWPANSPQRWGKRNHTAFNSWREEEVSINPVSNGWGTRYSAVPWEKTFCTSICLIPWRKICDAKRFLSTYKNIAEWDDSAGQEAFEKAKIRYWADINGLPCDITLPDPYMYIDKVNFDAILDPELIVDLENSIVASADGDNAMTNHVDPVANDPVSATGWNEAENTSINWDRFVKNPDTAPGWNGVGNACSTNLDSDNRWVCASGWRDGTLKLESWGSRRDLWKSLGSCTDPNGGSYSWGHADNWMRDHGRMNNRKRNGSHMDQKYTKSRHKVEGYQLESRWKSYGENTLNCYSHENEVHHQRTWQRGQFHGSRDHQRASAPWHCHNAVR